MGWYVQLLCDPEPKKKDIDSDVKLVIGEVETLDALASEIGVRPLGEFGLGALDEDVDWEEPDMFSPKQAIRSIEALLPILREPSPAKKGKGRKPASGKDSILDRQGVIEELEELLRRLKLVSKGKTKFRFVTVE
jgi:hypothetical protein